MIISSFSFSSFSFPAFRFGVVVHSAVDSFSVPAAFFVFSISNSVQSRGAPPDATCATACVIEAEITNPIQ